MRLTYKALLFLMLLTVPAFAQDPTGAPATANRAALMKFAANNQSFDAQIEDTAKALFHRQVPECAVITQAVRQLPTPYGMLGFPSDSAQAYPPPNNGVWAEHVKIRGCGKIWQVNLLGIGQREDKPLIFALLPGDTLSDPGSQGTAERMGATAIKKADASCADDATATYTRILGYKQTDGSIGKTDAGLGWFEEWVYKFCQKTVPAQLAFIPDGSGGYDIKARMVGALAPPKVPETKPAQTPPTTPKS